MPQSKERIRIRWKRRGHIEHGDFEFEPEKRKYSDLLTAESAEEARKIAKECSPRDYVIHHDKVEHFIAKHWPTVQPDYVTPYPETIWKLPNLCNEFRNQMFNVSHV